jgi:uncharacterized protein (TIGR03067 family)
MQQRHFVGLMFAPVLFALAADAGPGGDKAAADLKALEGTWRGWVVEGKGAAADKGPVHLEIVIRGDRITAKRLDDKDSPDLGEGTVRLGAGKPPTIDATRTAKPGKGKTYPGIYQLDGDTLRWCTAQPNGERPTELLTKRGQFLMVLKRQKS